MHVFVRGKAAINPMVGEEHFSVMKLEIWNFDWGEGSAEESVSSVQGAKDGTDWSEHGYQQLHSDLNLR